MKDKEGQIKVNQKIFFFLLAHLGFKTENELAKSLAKAIQVHFSAVSYCTGHNIEGLGSLHSPAQEYFLIGIANSPN